MNYKLIHKYLWLWLAKYPKAEKKHWPGWKFIYKTEFDFWSQCAACECVAKKMEKRTGRRPHQLDCRLCPISWPKLLNSNCPAHCQESHYEIWEGTSGEYRSREAAIIANLPWSEI